MDVDLLWQKRFRGLLPVSAGALDDDGVLTFVRPDELEARTYQIVCADPGGAVQSGGAISVETLLQLQVAARGAAMLGATDDDLYLFRDGRKTRLMTDRRLTFDDIALSRDGRRFVTAFSDMMVSAHTIALCDGTGKVSWTKDLDGTLTRVAISGDGSRLAVGSEEGRVLGFDAGRVPLFALNLGEPITALALSPEGSVLIAGTKGGMVAAGNDEGGLSWQATVGTPILGVAVSANGLVGAAIAGDASGGLLFCTDASGEPTWEHDLDARPTGVALSPCGGFLAVSLVDGRLMAFRLHPESAGRVGVAGVTPGLTEARAAWEDGERERACALLRDLLATTPADVFACELLVAWEAELIGEHLAAAEAAVTAGDIAVALEQLAAAATVDAHDPRLATTRVAVRARAVQALRERALREEEPAAAVAAWRALLAVDFKDVDARRRLGEAQLRWAAALTAEGETRAAGGDTGAALEVWRRAQELAPSEALEARIRAVELARIVAEGRRLYDAKRYPEAAFQFQKALALDPEHEEARRYLGYTRGLTADSGVAGRFRRLE